MRLIPPFLAAAVLLTGCAELNKFISSEEGSEAVVAADTGDLQGASDPAASAAAKEKTQAAVKNQIQQPFSADTGVASTTDGYVADVGDRDVASDVAAAAAADVEAAEIAASEDPDFLGYTDDGRVLKKAANTGPVKIECMAVREAPSRNFLPLDVRVTPLLPVSDLRVKIEPEDGVMLRDGPLNQALTQGPGERWTRRIWALPAGDRSSFLRITTSTTGATRTVLCPLADVPAAVAAPPADDTDAQDPSQIPS